MKNSKNYEYLLNDISVLKGIGKKTTNILKKKNIQNLFDLLWKLPKSFTDRTKTSKISELEIGKILTITVNVKKYLFPRVRNLPNKVVCQDETGELDCVFFNSKEGYIRKILPLNKIVTINGKVNYFRKKYQITNPTYVSQDESIIKKINSNYSLTEGITEKVYLKIINQILDNLPSLEEWHNKIILKKFNNKAWKDSILQLHDPKNIGDIRSDYYKRLAYDEILASFLISSQIRKKIKKNKKKSKFFFEKDCFEFIKKLNFKLTQDQEKSINEINIDLKSKNKMFRLLQGDVGSGKTIVSLISAFNVVKAGYQVAFMAPTEILSTQHFSLAKKIFGEKINIDILTKKTDRIKKENVLKKIKNNRTKIIFGTHSLFQKKVEFYNLGLLIIDEQHKFGVRQRMALSKKGGPNSDILLMSATPIPRTLIMSVYGDMDISIIKQKPLNRKKTITYSKPESKLSDVIEFVKKEIKNNNQVFWVCPLIEESKKIDHQSAINKYHELNKIFKNQVAIIHGKIDPDEKEEVLKNFLNKKYKILVSTTIIEVGIDFPNANLIVIEDSNKFGLSQLHQLRGRVGRGNKQATCILMFKKNLSNNAKKRIRILKSTDDGFKVAEEDMQLRGFGDVLGFKQSGIKNFKLADPIQNEDLFLLAEKEIKMIENKKENLDKYKPLLKLYDQANIINEIA